MVRIDLNCDMGESSDGQVIGNDEGVMPFISSANIACGFHGGDPQVMAATMLLAKRHQVAVGAHPSFDDRAYFGRREMELDTTMLRNLVSYQLGAAKGMALSLGMQLTHVKPHGALYNMAARREDYAHAIVDAVRGVDGGLVIFGLSGSLLISKAREAGLRTCSEVFADRSYQDDGSLTPRSQAGAMITDVARAVEQVVTMVREGRVRSLQGNWVSIKAETVCIHGDTPGAAVYAKAIREGLEAQGVEIISYLNPS